MSYNHCMEYMEKIKKGEMIKIVENYEISDGYTLQELESQNSEMDFYYDVSLQFHSVTVTITYDVYKIVYDFSVNIDKQTCTLTDQREYERID